MYTLSNNEIKYFEGQGAKGPWKKAAFTLTDGKEVSMWGDHPDFANLKAGATVSGDLTKGEYKGKEQWTLKPLAKQYAGGGKKNEIKAAIVEKNKGIEAAQTRKSENIQLSSSQRDAVLLVTTFYKNEAGRGDIDEFLKTKITAWRNWLLDEFSNEKPPF